jgi:hypothetical protein
MGKNSIRQREHNTLKYTVMAHVRNVEAFEKLKGICTGLGGAYNPGQQNLQVDALNTLFINAQQAMDAVMRAQMVYVNATNEREQQLQQLKLLASGLISLMKASGAKPLTIDDARSICRKIRGYSLNKKTVSTGDPAGTTEVKSVSVYGGSYANMVMLFARLIEMVEQEPGYVSQKPALTVQGLKATLAQCKALNRKALAAGIALSKARRKRNEVLYQSEQSLVKVAHAARNYVRGEFGFRSPQHREISRLRFTKLRV